MWKLPEPYCDELWYSVVSRYLERWKRADHRGLLEQILGPTTSVSAALSCPNARHLSKFQHPESDIDLARATRALLRKHTLAPYFKHFLPSATGVDVINSLTSDSPSLLSKVFTPASVSDLRYAQLKLCLECRGDDFSCRRTQYWRRSHQLPGISICPTHRVPLHVSIIPAGVCRRMHFQTVSLSQIGPLQKTHPIFRPTLEQRLLSQSHTALHRGATHCGHCSFKTYRALLLQGGYQGKRTKQMAINQFDSDFIAWLDENCLTPDRIGPERWWYRLLRSDTLKATPLQHMVLREYISFSLIERPNAQRDFYVDELLNIC